VVDQSKSFNLNTGNNMFTINRQTNTGDVIADQSLAAYNNVWGNLNTKTIKKGGELQVLSRGGVTSQQDDSTSADAQ
jgi:hypothetical protein